MIINIYSKILKFGEDSINSILQILGYKAFPRVHL